MVRVGDLSRAISQQGGGDRERVSDNFLGIVNFMCSFLQGRGMVPLMSIDTEQG